MVGFRNISYNYRKPSMGTEGNMELGLKIPGRPAQAALLNFIPGSHPLILPPKPHPPSSLLQPKRMGDFIVTHSRGCQEFTAPLLPAGDKSQGQSTRKVIHPPGSGFVYKQPTAYLPSTGYKRQQSSSATFPLHALFSPKEIS